MARKSEKASESTKIASVLNSLTFNSAKCGLLSEETLYHLVNILNKPNNGNMLPILVTEEDCEEIKQYREKAIILEKEIAKKKKEKYFDLVDQVKNVLQQIELRKFKKLNQESNDFNNNPFCRNIVEKGHEIDVNSNETNNKHSYNTTTQIKPAYNSSPIDANRFETGSKNKINQTGFSNQTATISPRNQFCQVSPNQRGTGFSNQSGYSTPDNMLQTKRFNHSTDHISPLSSIFNQSNSTVIGPHCDKSNYGRQCFGDSCDTLRTSRSQSLSQDDFLMKQQKLQRHFNTLQEQLLTEFQKQQSALLQSYKENEQLSLQSMSMSSNMKQTIVSETLRETEEFPQSPFCLSPKRKTPDILRSSNMTTAQSFVSELSTGDFYDIPSYNKVSPSNDKWPEEQKMEDENNIKQPRKPGFAVQVCTPPKIAHLSAFKKHDDNCKYMLVSAHIKGYITRRLFETDKIHGYVTTIKDAKSVLNDMNAEETQSITDRTFKERVRAQLQCAQDELRKIFVDPSPCLRIHILEQNRKSLLEKQTRNGSKVTTKNANRPKLSSVTMKKRLSRQERDTKHSNKPKSPTIKTTIVLKETPSPKRVEKPINKPSMVVPNRNKTTKTFGDKIKNTVSVTTTTVTTTGKTSTEGTLSGINGNTIANPGTTITTTAGKTTSKTTTTSTTNSITKPNTTMTAVKQVTTAGFDIKKTSNTRNTSRITKPNKTTSAQMKKPRKTWDSTSVLKPIQGRISPTIPSKTKCFDGKRYSLSATNRKIDHKIDNSIQENARPSSSTTTTTTTTDKKENSVHRTATQQRPGIKEGAKRSLAANLSMK